MGLGTRRVLQIRLHWGCGEFPYSLGDPDVSAQHAATKRVLARGQGSGLNSNHNKKEPNSDLSRANTLTTRGEKDSIGSSHS